MAGKTVKFSNSWRLNNIVLYEKWVIEEIRKEIKKSLNSNENENTIYQNLWDTPKAVLTGKFISMSTHFRKLERSQINNLVVYLKLLDIRTIQFPK
jgi:hypothetical protein